MEKINHWRQCTGNIKCIKKFLCTFSCCLKKCSRKLISKVISNAFKLIFDQIQSLYDESYFYFSFKQFWAIENPEPILEKIEKINC